MATFKGMDNSDKESQNSSEMSFNEVVTAAMAAGIAIWDMPQVPTQGNPYVPVPEPTRRQWVEILLSDAGRCYENYRMRPEILVRLHSILRDSYGLKAVGSLNQLKL